MRYGLDESSSTAFWLFVVVVAGGWILCVTLLIRAAIRKGKASQKTSSDHEEQALRNKLRGLLLLWVIALPAFFYWGVIEENPQAVKIFDDYVRVEYRLQWRSQTLARDSIVDVRLETHAFKKIGGKTITQLHLATGDNRLVIEAEQEEAETVLADAFAHLTSDAKDSGGLNLRKFSCPDWRHGFCFRTSASN